MLKLCTSTSKGKIMDRATNSRNVLFPHTHKAFRRILGKCEKTSRRFCIFEKFARTLRGRCLEAGLRPRFSEIRAGQHVFYDSTSSIISNNLGSPPSSSSSSNQIK